MSVAFRQYQTIQGSGDPMLKHSEVEGYQPVSRIGEIVINSFVDGYEWGMIKPQLSSNEIMGTVPIQYLGADGNVDPQAPNFDAQQAYGLVAAETKPLFHEWATALPGMICISRKARQASFRNYVAAETATPVIVCAACIPYNDMRQYYFAGICRSKSVRPIDDGMGPTTDEFFTLSIGGMATIVNNSSKPVFPGDMIAWTLFSEASRNANQRGLPSNKRARTGPRRIGIEVASPTSERVIGKCLSFAQPGETFDLLIKAV